jgi:hypothetical protein
LGSAPSLIVFLWDMQTWAPRPLHPSYPLRLQARYAPKGFVQRTEVAIKKPRPRVTMEVSHDPPALSREYLEVTVTLASNEDPVKEGILSFSIENETSNGNVGFFASDGQTQITEMKVGEIAPGESYSCILYVLSGGPNPERSLLFTFAYDTGIFLLLFFFF